MNKLCIFFWFAERNMDEQYLPGIHLTQKGLVLFFIFNTPLLLTLIFFLRVSLSNPGYIPVNFKKPFETDLAPSLYCPKCPGKTWKPARAHHDSISGRCVFKVRKYYSELFRWTTTVCGLTTA